MHYFWRSLRMSFLLLNIIFTNLTKICSLQEPCSCQFSKHTFLTHPCEKKNKISTLQSTNNWNNHCFPTFPPPTSLRIQSWKYLHGLPPHANHFKQSNCLDHFSILQLAHSSAPGRISPYVFTLFSDLPFLSLKQVKESTLENEITTNHR